METKELKEEKEEFEKNFMCPSILLPRTYSDSWKNNLSPSTVWQWIEQKLLNAKIKENEKWLHAFSGYDEDSEEPNWMTKDRFINRISELKQQ